MLWCFHKYDVKRGILTHFWAGDMAGRILTPLKENEFESIPLNVRPAAFAVNNAITAVRQAAEWGMGAVQKPFKRLCVPHPYDPQLRSLRIENIHRLYNVRVDRTGISQIRSVFFG